MFSSLLNRFATIFYAFIAILIAFGAASAHSQSTADTTPTPWVTGYYVAYQRDLLTPEGGAQ